MVLILFEFGLFFFVLGELLMEHFDDGVEFGDFFALMGKLFEEFLLLRGGEEFGRVELRLEFGGVGVRSVADEDCFLFFLLTKGKGMAIAGGEFLELGGVGPFHIGVGIGGAWVFVNGFGDCGIKGQGLEIVIQAGDEIGGNGFGCLESWMDFVIGVFCG
jgi:hypothetical protein